MWFGFWMVEQFELSKKFMQNHQGVSIPSHPIIPSHRFPTKTAVGGYAAAFSKAARLCGDSIHLFRNYTYKTKL
jgi:hypothetical protein